MRLRTFAAVFLSVTLLPIAGTASAQGTPPSNDDEVRVVAVAQAVAGLESYAEENFSYRVAGGGHRGNGAGWYQYVGGSYVDSIVNLLVTGGHLDGNSLVFDPRDTVVGSHSGYDLMVYHCGDRSAVFSRSDGISPSAEDSTWWADNGCTRHPIDRYDHSYFQVTDPVPTSPLHDDERVAGVGQAVEALESYGAANSSYRVAGGGHRGNGAGWYQHAGGTYPDSIANELVADGHLDAMVLSDPLYPSSRTYDFMVYHCGDRAAVFSRSNDVAPSVEDSTWWADNGCTRHPIDRYDHSYFQVTRPLSSEPVECSTPTSTNCVIVGNPPAPGSDYCPVSATVFLAPDYCYTLVSAPAQSLSCNDDDYVLLGALCKAINPFVDPVLAQAFECPDGPSGVTVDEEVQVVGAAPLILSCSYPAIASQGCPAPLQPHPGNSGLCRRQVDLRPGPLTCEPGFALIEGQCLMFVP